MGTGIDGDNETGINVIAVFRFRRIFIIELEYETYLARITRKGGAYIETYRAASTIVTDRLMPGARTRLRTPGNVTYSVPAGTAQRKITRFSPRSGDDFKLGRNNRPLGEGREVEIVVGAPYIVVTIRFGLRPHMQHTLVII